MIDIAIAGASGRMGREVVVAVHAHPDMRLSRALVSSASSSLGVDVGGLSGIGHLDISCTDTFEPDFDVLIDFSTVEAGMALLPKLIEHNKAVVICTTGFDRQQLQTIDTTATTIPLLRASNTSLGITLLLQLVRHAAARLRDADIEIIEAHHKNKVDAPSGTALTIGKAAAQARGSHLEDAIYQRQGHTGVRPTGPIGFATVRGGDIVGDHTVLLAMDKERIEITHRAENRALFAQGAVKAAQWLAQQQPGNVYNMEDVLDGMVQPLRTT